MAQDKIKYYKSLIHKYSPGNLEHIFMEIIKFYSENAKEIDELKQWVIRKNLKEQLSLSQDKIKELIENSVLAEMDFIFQNSIYAGKRKTINKEGVDYIKALHIIINTLLLINEKHDIIKKIKKTTSGYNAVCSYCHKVFKDRVERNNLRKYCYDCDKTNVGNTKKQQKNEIKKIIELTENNPCNGCINFNLSYNQGNRICYKCLRWKQSYNQICFVCGLQPVPGLGTRYKFCRLCLGREKIKRVKKIQDNKIHLKTMLANEKAVLAVKQTEAREKKKGLKDYYKKCG